MNNHGLPVDAAQAEGFLQPDAIRNDAVDIISTYIAQNRHGRGPFLLQQDEQRTTLPGMVVPSWLGMLLNELCSSDLTQYNNDRPGMLRDLLFLGAAGVLSAIARTRDDDPLVQRGIHMIRHEETLRSELYVEELLLNYVEDITIVAQALRLKMEAGDHEEVFNSLRRLFDHATSAPTTFWRRTILRLMFGSAEVREALAFLRDEPRFSWSHEYQGWGQLAEEVRNEG